MKRSPRITVSSKQDAFIFRNHAAIPTVSFGVSGMMGPGGIHSPDEHVAIEDAWNGFRIAARAVQGWLAA
jgi:acetylornithine deacetylase/succinyl-diaminopimelate desuccinylase-like protein